MKWRPAGHRILIKPTEITETTKSGLLLATDIKEKEDFNVAEVIDMGPSAFKDFGENWCKVGDLILFPRFAGALMPNSKDCLRIINDQDVIAIGELEQCQ